MAGLLMFHAVVLWLLEFVPSPELFINPYLVNHGWLPYAQIIDQHSPGLLFFPVNLASLGLATPTLLKALLIGLVIFQSLWIYKISRSKWAVGLWTAWQLFFAGNNLWFDSFLAVLTLPAYWLWTQKKWLVTGLLLGTAVVIKQSILPLVAFVAVATWWQTRGIKSVLQLSLGVAIPTLLTALYFFKLGVGSDFWYWLVTFSLTIYPVAGKLAPSLREFAWLAVPLGLFALSAIRGKNKPLIGWALFSVLGGLSRYDRIHFQPALPFLALSLVQLPKKWLQLTLIVSVVWVSLWYSKTAVWGGVRYFDPQTMKLVEEIKQRTQPGQKIFLLGTQPHLYVLTQTLPAGNVFAFHIPWILQIVQDRIWTGLVADSPQLVVWDTSSRVGNVGISESAPKLVQYVVDNYQPVATVGANIIYQK
ncbi:MAG: hypothetical protein Q7S31_01205 [bacterium]|nr:hypothetical protein [bacterium]